MAASSSFLCLALGSVLLFHVCFAQIEQMPLRSGHDQQHRKQQQRWQTECRLDRLNALQPSRRVQSEAGVSEYWDLESDNQLQCAGVSAVRHTIQNRGLLLPFFSNAPVIFYVIQGMGFHGAVIPGCPETFEESGFQQSQRSQEQHQKVREIFEGDIVAAPAGVAQWVYNNGDSPLVLVSFTDVGNQANQLDLNTRRFHIGGNPQKDQRSEQEMRQQSQSLSRRRRSESASERRNPNGNIFSGFDVGLLAESFKIDNELASRLQNQNDRRERIVRVREDLHIVSPGRIQEEERRHEYRRGSYDEEEYRRRSYGGEYKMTNGLEETFCTLRMRHNIDRPSQADIFNPRGGRVTTVNNFNLPILRFLRLTAERGVLYKNAMMAPHFNLNSHSVFYVTRGSGRCQIVDDFGRNVFDGEVQEGQLLVVPQNYAVVKQAGNRGFEWIAIKTNDNAMRNPLAGRISAIRAMPEDVLSNAFSISREQARNLKNNREEVTVFSTQSSQQGRKY
ncbi:hypothetical protein TIFTF001_022534 [Ficus carica]|uniref:11S seed storage protein n=1 Tax=Ficus carica TaxID=3494 RepID=A0AA88AI03_FICCA|nr:hypothetical protein TIFTF001_022534 [Ficus carica]